MSCQWKATPDWRAVRVARPTEDRSTLRPMGLKEWAAKAPMGTFGFKDQVVLYRDRVQRGKEEFPLTGVSARVEVGSEIQQRVTATRLLAIGIFALAAKKKSGGESYLTLEGPDFFWTLEVDRKEQAKAREFAAKVNNQVRSV